MYALIRILRRLWILSGMPAKALARRIRHDWLGQWWPSYPDRPVTVDVAVVIPCHNYARFLPDAVDSVLRQTMRPREILIVDDASDDGTAEVALRYAGQGVRYARVEYRSLSRTRNFGAQQTQAMFLCYLDADDRLPPDYLQQCLREMHTPAVGVVYTDQKQFGESRGRIRRPPFDRSVLVRLNYISSNALIRRQALELAGGFRDLPHAMEDWDFFLRVTRMGYTAAKAKTFLQYRVHPGSRIRQHHRSSQYTYANDAALHRQQLTVFTPFLRASETFGEYLEGIRAMDLPPEHITLHWLDLTGDAVFGAQLRAAQAELPFGRLVCTRAERSPLWAHEPLLPEVFAYNTMLTACDTDYVVTVDQDIRLQPGTIRRLLDTMHVDVAAVGAPCPSATPPLWEAWETAPKAAAIHPLPAFRGVREVGGCGLGCTLFRTAMLRQMAPVCMGEAGTTTERYDRLLCYRLRTLARILCDGNAAVERIPAGRKLAAATVR